MFISKKKFNMMLEEAALKREKELDEKRAIGDQFDYLRDDMNHRFKYVRRDVDNLERRISQIEKELHPEPEKKCCCENQAVDVKCARY